jgi:site-specific DNA-methyltransferase (adenine-specific)
MPDNSVDSIVTDPPYGLSFMGKKWDYDVPSVEIWAECLRVLKPGGHLLAFAGTRTQHRMAVRIEDAGFEIRDMIAWVYGSGFPKSLDVSKAIDKAAGADREVVDTYSRLGRSGGILGKETEIIKNITTPSTEAARQWQGWGTALKPALEPITVARKPLIGTVAENVLEHGTGGLNIDGCRVGTEDKLVAGGPLGANSGDERTGKALGMFQHGTKNTFEQSALGRWPANLIHDGSDDVVGLFPTTTSGAMKSGTQRAAQDQPGSVCYGTFGGNATTKPIEASSGSAARFFYCAKASKCDRDEGLEGFEAKATAFGNQAQAELKRGNLDHDDGKSGMNKVKMRQNSHPTVKPTDLMRYLCRLVTQPGGVVLDPFMGSGSTGKAAKFEGFEFVGCEMSPEYFEIARARIEAASKEPVQDSLF